MVYSPIFTIVLICVSIKVCQTRSLSSSFGSFFKRGSTTSVSKKVSKLDKFSSSPIQLCKALELKGGKDNKKTLKDIEEEEDDDETDDDDIQLGEGGKQNQMVSSMTDMWKKTPPMTKIYIGSSIFFTTCSFILNKNVWPEFLHLEWKNVLTRFEFWRPITAFLFYGPLGLNYILTIQFVWTYMAQLEKLNYKTPADFFIQMIFGASSLLALYVILGISPKYLGHNLSTFLVYIWARVFEGSEVNVMDLFNLKAEILPWFFCLQTFVLEGEIPFADILGIVVGHLYYYLSKRKLLTAPPALQTFFSSEYFSKQYAQFKDDFE